MTSKDKRRMRRQRQRADRPDEQPGYGSKLEAETEGREAELVAPAAAAAAEPAAEEKMDAMPVAVVEMPYQPYGGAVTWDQLDEFMDGQDEAHAIRKTTYQFQDLVDNIMSDDTIENKGERVAAVAEEFDRRLQMERAKEAAEAEPQGIAATLRSWINAGKAALSTGTINDLPDSAFAFIESGGTKDAGGKTTPRSLRHYPIHDAAHVRNALARASQQIARGGKGAAIAKKALAKIKAAAARMKIGTAGKEISGFTIEKDRAGNYRWIGWASGHWRDQDYGRHEKGELIPSEAHQRFIKWLDAKPGLRAPQLWAWHTPGTATKHAADWWDYADGFLVLSGPLTKAEGERLAKLAKKVSLAMSHGFLGWNIDAESGVIGDYRSYEVSYLPRQKAAAVWTAFETIRKEAAAMLNPDKRAFLVAAIGEDRVRDLEAETKGAARTLDAVLESKEADEPEEPAAGEGAPAAEGGDDGTPVEEPAAEPEAMKALAKMIGDQIEAQVGVTKLNGFLTTIAGQVASIEKTVTAQAGEIARLKATDDEKVASALRPPAAAVVGKAEGDLPIWLRAASASDDNVLPADAEGKPHPLSKGPSKDAAPAETAWARQTFGAPQVGA